MKSTVRTWIAIVLIIILAGCLYHSLNQDGFKSFRSAFDGVGSTIRFHEKIKIGGIEVNIVSDKDMFEDWANDKYGPALVGYVTEKEVYVLGKIVNGKIIVDQAVLGHEFNHLLNIKNSKVANPDRLEELIK